MKKAIIFFIAITFSISISAQEWQTDFETAKQISSEENRPIILVFQGSDWCAPCMKLDREIWSTEEFKKYAKEHFVMLQADFPRKKRNELPDEQQQKNSQLAEKYNKQGYFPFVVILDKKGTVLGEAGYVKTSPETYIEKIESFVK